MRCICGGHERAVHMHHVIYEQAVRRAGGDLKDARNLVPVSLRCHSAHHSRARPLTLSVLPDSVYEFALEVLGAGAAYEYLRRRYDGEDWRLDELLHRSEHGP